MLHVLDLHSTGSSAAATQTLTGRKRRSIRR